jgi:hypothetical protein
MPDLEYRLGGRRYVLVKQAHMYTIVGGRDFDNGYLKYEGRTGLMTFRAGYSWDGCSIPKWVFWLRRTKKTKKPGLGHDGPYQLGRNGVFAHMPNAREMIDGHFYYNLVTCKNGKSKAWQMWQGVRIGGASSFDHE